MARIPQYRSQVDPAVGTRLNLPRVDGRAFGAQVGVALQGAGADLQREAARRKREQEEAETNAAMLDAAKRFEESQAALEARRLEARTEAAADGTGHAEAMVQAFDETRDQQLEAITNPKAKAWAELQFIRARGQMAVQEQGFATGLRVAKTVDDAATARDLAANTLFTNPDRGALDAAVERWEQTADALNVPANVRAKFKAETREMLGRKYLEGLAEQNPYQARAEIDSGSMNAIVAPEAISVLRNRADTEIRGREAQARAEERARRAEAAAAERERRQAERDYAATVRETARDMIDGLQAGVTYSPEEIGAVAGAAARAGGGALLRNLGVAAEQAQTATALRGATPRQVTDTINGLAAEVAKGGRDAPVLAARLEAARAVQSAQRSGLGADPLSYATTQGVVALAPLDPTDPASVRARVGHARVVRARYGVNAILTEPEVDEYQQRLYSGDANQKMAALLELQQLGPGAAAVAFRQIGKGNPEIARAGALLTTAGGRNAARRILTGQQALKADPKLVPQADFMADSKAAMGRALRFMPELEAQTPAAARAFLAGGMVETGATGSVSRAAVATAVSSSLERVRGNDGVVRGGLGERRGHKVLLPSGKTEEEFNAAIDRFTLASLPPKSPRPVLSDGRPLTDAQLRRARPFAVGDGQYVLAADANGDDVIMDTTGRPFVMRIR